MCAANGLGHLAAYSPRSVVSRKSCDEGTRRPSKEAEPLRRGDRGVPASEAERCSADAARLAVHVVDRFALDQPSHRDG
jgi:hypothetical protein